MTVSAAGPAELTEALALLYGPDDDVGHAFRMVARGELDPKDLFVARRDGAVIGAVFASRVPGGVAVVWPPRAGGDDPAIEDQLVAVALAHVTGAKVIQAFLPPEEAGRAAPLLRAGFRHATRVWEMVGPPGSGEPGCESPGRTRSGESSPPADARPALTQPGSRRVEIAVYRDCDPSTFHATLVRAHDESLDCPELHGRLTPDEVLAGYRDTAPDPGGWWLAVADDQPAGVLLMNGNELTFLGVVPEWRGKGVGRRLLEMALARTSGLTLVVDARNAPAIRLYRSAGLAFVGAREVFLYFPGLAAGTAVPKVCRS
jgi:ribosomal protein S18 acetylase RimI-like enzyme